MKKAKARCPSLSDVRFDVIDALKASVETGLIFYQTVGVALDLGKIDPLIADKIAAARNDFGIAMFGVATIKFESDGEAV